MFSNMSREILLVLCHEIMQKWHKENMLIAVQEARMSARDQETM
jgi:hypothetical protein